MAGGSVTLLNGISLPGTLAARAAGNDIGRIDGFTAGGDFTLASTVPLLRTGQLVSAGTGRELRLFADDFALGAGLAAPGGTVSLSPYLRDGSAALVLGGASGASTPNAVTLDSAELDLLPVGATARLRLGQVDTPDGGSDFGQVAIAGRVDLADPATGLDARTGRLELHARGGIVQQAGTRLVVPVLAATAVGDILLDPGDGANRIEQLAGIVSEAGRFSLRDGLPGGAVRLLAGSVVAGDAGAGPDAILVGRSVPGGGRTITLQADDLDIQAPVRAPGGTIEIAPHTAGREVALGGAAIPGGSNTLHLATDELARLGGGAGPGGLAAQVLRIGHLDGQPAAGAGLISIRGDVTLRGATAQVQALELFSAGAIRGSGGAVIVPALRAAAAGDVILDNAGNSFLVNAVSGPDVAIAQSGDLRLANAVAAVGGIAAPGGAMATGTLSLIAGGSIGQDGGALIQAGTLRLQAEGPVTLGERNRFNTLAAATVGGAGASLIRGFGYTISGPVTTTGSLRLVATDFGNLVVTGSVHAGGDLLLLTERGEASGAPPRGEIAVSGSLGAGRALSLATDLGTIALTGATLQSGEAMTLATGTLGRAGLADIRISGSNLTAGGAFGITAGLFAAAGQESPLVVTGSMLRAGGALALASGEAFTIGNSGLTASGSQSWHADTGAMSVTDATATAGTTLTLRAGGDFGIAGSSLTAGTGLGIVAARGVGVTGTGLTAWNGGLGIAANGAGMALDTTDVTAGGAMTLTAAGTINQRRGRLVGDSLVVQAGQEIGVTADGGASPLLRTVTGALTLAARAGDVSLTGATLASAADLGLTAATGGIRIAGSGLAAAAAMVLDARGAVGVAASSLAAGGGALGIRSAQGSLSFEGSALAAGEAVSLTALQGGIGQVNGSVTGGSMTLRAGLGIGLSASGGQTPSLTSTAGGIDLAGAGGIALSGATLTAAQGIGLTAAGAVTIADAALRANGGALTVLAGRTLGITGSALRASGDVGLTARGDVALTGAALEAAGGGIALSSAGLVAAGALGLTAGGTLQTIGVTATAGGTMSLATGGAMSLGGSSLAAGGGIDLAAGGDTGLTHATLSAMGGVSFAGGGAFTAMSSRIASGAGMALASRLAASLADSTLTAGGSLSLAAGAGGVTVTRGSITGAGDAALRGAGDLLVTDGDSSTQPALRSTGGALSLRSDNGGVVLRNAAASGATGLGLAAGGAISLTDTTLTTPGRLAAAAGSGSLAVLRSNLASTAGDVLLTAGGTGAIGASTLRAGQQVRVVTGGGMTLAKLTLDADTGDFEAGRPNPAAYGSTSGAGAMTTDGGTATIGSALLFAAPGGVAHLGPVLVTPRGGPLPAVLFDTRLAPDRSPLTIVRPDIAGTPPNQQPTQVRSAPGAQGPGAFGLPDQTTAAGPVALNLNAGRSAVFLLVDGGSVSGTVTAGRLAVHGAGGGATLFGALDGSVGAEAARFADITRPIEASSLQKYRINSCVIGSINCVVPPSIQLLPPRPTDQARFTIENNRINLSDVLIPNIGEEDDQ
ncbi:hemagglutinin repeat-containing protein [Belnapia sp. F-4-1]|uniref:beta strand repeat-containing protein n=1 Tax=Belnapia sp. F-4-1 TaxID=1545443 RepID=UPI001F46A5D5|nr:hemagglutinin repeat-containing protein [Belnapia sp. F-4-1]